LQWFKFLGMLMGITLRTKGNLGLNLPSLLWKPLVGLPLDLSDLESIDLTTSKVIQAFKEIEKDGITEDTFSNIFFETFTTRLPDSTEVELKPKGKDIEVTFQNRLEYCELVQKAHLNAYEKQVSAIKQGMAMMVPMVVLEWFGWQHLELLVCGRPTLDLPLLKSQTEYGDGIHANDQHVQFFWKTMENLAPEDHSLFLRFVWGRSRLPLTASGFTKKFKINPLYRDPPDHHLPEAHTCFFTIDLPKYSTYEVTREKVLYAIRNCFAIDMDNDNVDRSEWRV